MTADEMKALAEAIGDLNERMSRLEDFMRAGERRREEIRRLGDRFVTEAMESRIR